MLLLQCIKQAGSSYGVTVIVYSTGVLVLLLQYSVFNMKAGVTFHQEDGVS